VRGQFVHPDVDPAQPIHEPSGQRRLLNASQSRTLNLSQH
jgi:hypothetical protein